ncbi:zinc ribbon domain-containing protein [Candidatus Woesearchaeota archaeon]|nr:zinc ribbon domain-containing protein [Candidatus Woesearchaeota archaeon]
MRRIPILLLALMLIIPLASAEVYLSNSKDWRDVYSVMMYGNFENENPRFLVSDKHGTLILNSIDTSDHIEIFTSQTKPYVVGYESTVKSAGFDAAETKSDDLNLLFAEKLTDVKDFIIIDDAYGYNAIAVAPYAVLSRSYVLFANSGNIDDVESFLDDREAEHIIIYGHIDREVHDVLSKYSPEIINQDGDRFANNVEIVKKYRKINPKKQVVLTNGEFIEAEVVSGLEPVLFIGRQNVPDKIKEYIQSTDIEVGVLIGNELVGTATTVRRQVGISTFVKFAQGARAAAGNIAQVEGLDMFPVPKVALNLEIQSVKYNKLTGKVEITFKNNAAIATYIKGTYTLSVGGEEFTFGDADAVFIDKNDLKTIAYAVDGVSPEGELTLKAYVLYGESKNALEFVIDKTFTVSTVEVSDSAQLAITKLEYDKARKAFIVSVENTGSVDAYYDAEVVDVLILGEKTTLSSDEVQLLKQGAEGYAPVTADLSDSDIEANPTVHVRVHYGERSDALISTVEGDMELKIRTTDVWTYLPVALIILLLLLLLFGQKKCPSCGKRNPRGRKHCKKCGHVLK